MGSTTIASEIDLALRARTPLMYLVTWDEERCVELLGEVATRLGRRIARWTHTRGLESQRALRTTSELADPVAMIDYALSRDDRTVYVMMDVHPFLSNPLLVRKFKDAAAALASTQSTLVIVSSVLHLPAELTRYFVTLDVGTPNEDEILDATRAWVARSGMRVDQHPPAEIVEEIARACSGLTLREVSLVLSRAQAERGRLDEDAVRIVRREKQRAVRSSGMLHAIQQTEGLNDVGGLDVLKRWLESRAQAFTARARTYGLPAPRGLLLAGVQGSGKSLCARASAQVLRLPLYRMDIGSAFTGLVGGSEANIRQSIAIAEASSPCVLWIDEIDKALAGSSTEHGSSDGGTATRVLGTLLTWMQEKTAPVFIVATANGIASLPPEMLRKGRFDEVFFVDLPGPAERLEIARIHLLRRAHEPRSFDLESLAASSDGMSGAEIEQAIISGMFHSFAEDRPLETRDVIRALRETVPLAHVVREQIDALRTWASTRARNASTAHTSGTRTVMV